MAKVDWITWKTNSSEIIDYEKENEIINQLFQELNNTYSIIQEDISYEIKEGGLSENNLNLGGMSPAYEQAKSIIESIEEINEIKNKLNKKLQSSIDNQKQIEKKQLIDAINQKIQEEEKIKNNTTVLYDKLPQNNSIMEKSEIKDIINNIDERIKLLREKLEIASSL